MKVIDAFWEERNLGVTCYEIQMELSDKLEAVVKELDSFTERQYMVVKIPSSRYDLLPVFQSRGYYFIETQIRLETIIGPNYQFPNISPALKKLCDRCAVKEMNDTDIEHLYQEIKNGMFDTDRVYIDPFFTPEQAANRYIGWTRDLIAKGDTQYKTIFNGTTFGFFNGALGGVYNEYKGSGMGFCFRYALAQFDQLQGIKKRCVRVSANNPDIFKLHTYFGARIKGFEYVYCKHNV